MRSCLISWNKVDWQEGHCMNTLMLSNISGPTNNHPGFRKYFPVQLKLSSWTSVGCYLELERGTPVPSLMQYLDQFWYICDKVLVLIRFSNMNKENKDKSDIYILGYDQSLNLTLPPIPPLMQYRPWRGLLGEFNSREAGRGDAKRIWLADHVCFI